MLKVSATYNEDGTPAGNIPGEIGNLREQVRILREVLEKLRDCVREIPCNNYTPSLHDAAVTATKILEATKGEN